MDALERLGLDSRHVARAQPAPRVRDHHRVRPRGRRARPRRVRHRRVLGPGRRRRRCSPRPGRRRRSSAAAWATTASPWTSPPRSTPRSSRATARVAPAGQLVATSLLAPRHVHDLLRPQHAPAARRADRDRLARDDVEPGDELLPHQGRPVGLAHRPRSRPPLAHPVPRRRPPRVDRRPALPRRRRPPRATCAR